MRAYALPLLAGLALITSACGSEGQPGDAGRDASDASGGGGKGGTGGAGRGGTGGSVGGQGGSTAGTGGSGTGGSTPGTGGSVGTGGSTAGTGGSVGTGGATAGTGGSTAGTGGSSAGTGGSIGTGGSVGTGGATAGTGGSVGTGGSTAGTGGSTGAGGATAGTGGATGTAGSTGTGGSATGTGGGGTGGSIGTGGSVGTGGATAGTGGTAGSTGGSTGTGGATGTAGTGGSGVACTSASTCPGGADTECQHKTCIGNVCGLDFTAANTPVAAQTAGDCHRNVCDGVGGIMAAIFDGDPPADDANPCTGETCVNGLPSHPPEPARTACEQGIGTMCNGSSSAPACVACLLATDCPGTDTSCQTRICGNQNTCGFSNKPAGTAATDATGNCRKAVCDDVGGIASMPDDTDVPADDGNPCTDDVCASGAPSHPAKSDGTACAGSNGAKVCSGAACVQCLVKSDCAGTDTPCRQIACQNDHTCGHVDLAAGTAAGADATGNCHKQVCDGAGAVISAVDDTDKPVDGNSCTGDVCTNGTATNPNLPAGTLCTTTALPPDGSKVCDGSAGCNTLSFRVVRVGPGTTSAATPVAIEEWRSTSTVAVSTIDLPMSASGTNKPLTLSGSASSEGCLSLSADGHKLVLAGYGVTPGTPSVKGTTGSRVAALIDIAGTPDTSTVFNTGDSGDNVRGATTVDGVDVWISGTGSPGANGGIWYNQHGLTTGETRVVSSPNNTRCVAVFGGQLYGSSGSGTFTNVFSIGFGTPTSAVTATSLPGMPTSGASPFGFTMVDLAISPSGVDTMYVADETAGLQKWTYDGSTWTLVATWNVSGSTGFRGVAGYAAGKTVTLLASTAESAPNHLVVFVDDGITTPVGTTIATAPASSTYRGVALSPHFAAP